MRQSHASPRGIDCALLATLCFSLPAASAAAAQSVKAFLNEGVALPHARIAGLQRPQMALGITHAGVLDVPTDNPIEVAFMLLSPTEHAAAHLRVLANASRMLQSRELRRRLAQATTPNEALAAISDYELSIRRQ